MAASKKGKAAPPSAEKHVGTVEHYYPKVKAAAVHLDAGLKVGDTIHIKGATDDYTEKVTSLQMDHKAIAAGRPGENIGVRVPVKVHQHSEVLKVELGAAPAAAKAKPAPARTAKKVASKSKPAKKPAAKRSVRKAPKKATRKAPKGGKKGKSGKRSKGSNKAKATKARKVARKTARKGKRRGR